MFYILLITSVFHVVIRLIQLYIWDAAFNAPGSAAANLVDGGNLRDVGGWLFFDFLRIQSPLLFLIMVYAGAGLICNDFRNNLMEVYFSKPLTWIDYVMGKVGTLVALGLAVTALPALGLLALHALFVPTLANLQECAALILPIIAFSTIMVASMALCILASSSMVNSSRVAGIAIFLLLFTDSTIGGPVGGHYGKNESCGSVIFRCP